MMSDLPHGKVGHVGVDCPQCPEVKIDPRLISYPEMSKRFNNKKQRKAKEKEGKNE